MILDEDICTLIPQRAPFVMIDRLIFSGEAISRTAFTVTSDNILVEDGLLTEAGLLENIAQTAGARAGYGAKQECKPVSIGYIGAVKNFEITHLPQVNDLLETEIKIENQIFNATLISGKVWCRNVVLAQCEMKIFITEK